jgi:ATP-dependent Lon protease
VFTRLYRINVILPHAPDKACPMVIESAPTMTNLLGLVEREFLAGGMVHSDHLMIHAGSLLQADGGLLILETRDVLAEPGAWKVLVRTLRTGRLEIIPSELAAWGPGPLLKPEPIAVNIKVILLGDPALYSILDTHDPDFAELFKVLADFDTSIARNQQGVRYYAGFLTQLDRQEGLPPFARDAVVALTEQGARIAARRDRLTTQFGRLADIAREAAFLARRHGTRTVTGAHVQDAIRRRTHRADLPARHFHKLMAEGAIRLRFLRRPSHPLAFSASIAFEQSYGGIDGDSASGAEMCCLLSALTDVPLRQDLAMTGAIDQVGHIQPVGAVTEKIEGFFDTCQDLGLTGMQGVIIPQANRGVLMLRPDVVEACEAGRFHVYAVETIHQALELLTGRPAGYVDSQGQYPEHTLLRLAVNRARDYWRMAAASPADRSQPVGE